MYRFLVSLAVLASLSYSAENTKQGNKIETVAECIAKTEGRSFEIRRCVGEETDNIKKEIEIISRKFIKALDPEKREQHIKAHGLWLEYKKAQCSFEDSLYMDMGTIGRDFLSASCSSMYKVRLEVLQNAYDLRFDIY